MHLKKFIPFVFIICSLESSFAHIIARVGDYSVTEEEVNLYIKDVMDDNFDRISNHEKKTILKDILNHKIIVSKAKKEGLNKNNINEYNLVIKYIEKHMNSSIEELAKQKYHDKIYNYDVDIAAFNTKKEAYKYYEARKSNEKYTKYSSEVVSSRLPENLIHLALDLKLNVPLKPIQFGTGYVVITPKNIIRKNGDSLHNFKDAKDILIKRVVKEVSETLVTEDVRDEKYDFRY